MRPRYIVGLLGTFMTIALGAGALAAGVDFGAIAVVANGALIYGLTAALR